ncbi:MAG: M15 family metallopeptidase [Oscillospiraceae bacterium]|nr:M15 family metallopeptidase [Oscillospiraceae bacterium]
MNPNDNHPSTTVQQRNRRLLYFVVLPISLLLALAVVLFCILYPSAAVPASTLAGDGEKQSVLSNFSDDLGQETALQFVTVEKTKADLSQGSLVLVNNDTVWPFPKMDSLVNVYDNAVTAYSLSGTDLLLQKEVMTPLNDMMTNFRRITGFSQVMLSEGYRSEATQAAVYQQAQSLYGDNADEIAAKPGRSEYHTGYAIGFSLYTDDGVVMDFSSAEECDWLLRNCDRYGFIQRYPEGKESITGYAAQPYHFRYVGKPHAYLMRLKQYCLEEYLEYVSHYPYDGNHIQVTDNENQKYEIYYVPAGDETTAVPVPEDRPYTISGDNQGGFIVTVTLEAP